MKVYNEGDQFLHGAFESNVQCIQWNAGMVFSDMSGGTWQSDPAKFKTAMRAYAEALAFSRCHHFIACKALADYGYFGPDISGCVREHFPEAIKEELRAYCRLMNEARDAGDAARPKGVRKETMHRLFRAMKEKLGSGYY